MIIISGIRPSRHGAGRLMDFAVREASLLPGVRFLFGAVGDDDVYVALRKGRVIEAAGFFLSQRRRHLGLVRTMMDSSVIDEPSVIIFHPQTVGFAACMEFVERRRHPTWLYLLDSGFFCIRSYNHVEGESAPCLRCLGGRFENADRMGCGAFPVRDRRSALRFVSWLRECVRDGRVGLFAQTSTQAGLAREHFGVAARVETCGVWASDWDLTDDRPEGPLIKHQRAEWDVVFHGSMHHAKGLYWALELAGRCEGLRFLFPFGRKSGLFRSSLKAPHNCFFVPMRWESGLKEAVETCKAALVPSLWSAPVEGALVKSIIRARVTAVVANQTSFSIELPSELALRLPGDVVAAASLFSETLASGWSPRPEQKTGWFESFALANRPFIRRINSLAADTPLAGESA